MNNHNGGGSTYKALILRFSKLINRNRYDNVSKDNRLVTSYMYGFDRNISPFNRIVGAEVDMMNHQSQEGTDEKEQIFKKTL
jgi:hypothetical protein